MNQTTKNWLIAGAALVLIGVLVLVGGVAMSHWDFSAFGAKYETKAVDVDEGFRNLTIRADTEDIAFIPSDNGTCRVVFYERENRRHTASVHDGTLLIEGTDTEKWHEHFTLFSTGSPRITVYLPQNDYASLYIEEDTGDIVMPADFRFESAEIAGGTGDVEWYSSSGQVQMELSTGEIRIEDIFAEKLELSVSTGRVEVRSVACAGDVSVNVSTGKTTMSDVTCKRFCSTGSTGDVFLENVIVSEGVTIERSTGDVRFERCDAAELSIQTDTGDVSGSLLSDKVFIARSDTGGIDVPQTITGGKCEISTDTGDIDIVIS